MSHEEDLREIIVLAENAKSDTLTCPLCNGVFRDPYIAACGVSRAMQLIIRFAILIGHFVLASQGLLGHCTFVMEIMS